MKKIYVRPVVETVDMKIFSPVIAVSAQHNATYGPATDGKTDNIGTAGDNDDFSMESKKHNMWDADWD